MQQVQSAGQPKRRRKGISVSLTPEKRGEQATQVVGSKIELVRLDQSFARFDQQPINPQYVRVFSSIKPVEIPVRFSYSNVSKDHQIKESQALNQEIYTLRREIEQKRQIVDSLQQKQGMLATSNVRAIYVSQQPPPTINNHKSVRCQQPVQSHREHRTPPSLTFQTSQRKLVQQTKIVPEIQNPKAVVNSFIVLEAPPNSNSQQKLEGTQVSQKQYLSEKAIEPIVEVRKYEQEKSLTSINTKKIEQKLTKVEQNIQVKKSPQKPSTTEKRSSDKQNEAKQNQRLQRLKWAEQKLLDIIRVCDQGL